MACKPMAYRPLNHQRLNRAESCSTEERTRFGAGYRLEEYLWLRMNETDRANLEH